MAEKTCDLAVIGSGPGGYVAAIRASQLGMKVVIVERDALGGVCLNWGCIPTKALLRTAEVYTNMKHAAEFGLKADGIGFDLKAIVERSRGVAGRMEKGVTHLMKKNKIEVVKGVARLEKGAAAPVVKVKTGEGEDKITAKHVILATGARARTIPQAGLEPDAVDVETFAMERAFGELRHQLQPPLAAEDDCVALVDIGATMNSFHVLRQGRVTYSRDTVFGGRQLTEEIRSRYGLSLEEAGLAKKRGGLPDDYPREVLEPFLDTLVQQIGRSLQLYYTAGRKFEVKRLMIAGGSSVVPGLSERLTQDSGMDVTIANPFLRMKINSRIDIHTLAGDAPAMLTACGLAMRARR